MLRPSDIAPSSVLMKKDSQEVQNIEFCIDHLKFLENKFMEVTLFGIKNDYHRDGFKVPVPPFMNPSLCPVKALQCYIERTSYIRPLNRPVFLSLNKPCGPLAATGVANVLNTAINLAGLDGKGYTARSFRPTGATTCVIKGQDPNIVHTMDVGSQLLFLRNIMFIIFHHQTLQM